MGDDEQNGSHILPDKPKPCRRCKAKHLKCIYPSEAQVCQRCQRADQQCLKADRTIRFRDVSIPKPYGKQISRKKGSGVMGETFRQSNLGSERDAYTCVNQSSGHRTSNHHTLHDKLSERSHFGLMFYTNPSEASNAIEQTSEQTSSPTSLPDPTPQRDLTRQDASEKRHVKDGVYGTEKPGNELENSEPGHRSAVSWEAGQDDSPESIDISMHSSMADPSSLDSMRYDFDGIDMDQPQRKSLLDSPAHAVSDDRAYVETILLRYFQEEVAPWFDICDPARHFVAVLPHYARKVGPVRSAMLTLAARNLSRNPALRSSPFTTQWNGHMLTGVTDELAITYHNECIHELMQLSLDEAKLFDATLLAATVILRTDEEMLHEAEDRQVFLKITNLFIDAQLKASPASRGVQQSTPSPWSNATLSAPDATVEVEGLQQACLGTALRQDIHATLLTQQPVKFPLSRCEGFRSLDPASDAVWTTRMVVFCADVLEFCYGSESIDGKVLPTYDNDSRWKQLRTFEKGLCAARPDSFEPTYFRDADRDEIFPRVLYLTSLHISGTTYVELARILLEVFDPTRPSTGHASMKALKTGLASAVKILYRLCGIAISNSYLCPPSLVNASLGIALLGEYVEMPADRSALLDVLSFMTERYNYFPASQIARSLLRVWTSDEP